MASTVGDVELFSEVLQVQHKVFYIDLKENSRGRYFKIAERGKFRPKSTVVVSVSGLAQFVSLLGVYMDDTAAGRDMATQDVCVEHKVFNFSVGDNDRGRFLRIVERGGGVPAGGASLIIPTGADSVNIRLFHKCLEKMDALLQQLEPFVPGAEGAAAPRDAVLVRVDMPGAAPALMLKANANKQFLFNVHEKEQHDDSYLEIKEMNEGAALRLIEVPLSAVPKFQEALTTSIAKFKGTGLDPGGAARGSSSAAAGPFRQRGAQPADLAGEGPRQAQHLKHAPQRRAAGTQLQPQRQSLPQQQPHHLQQAQPWQQQQQLLLLQSGVLPEGGGSVAMGQQAQGGWPPQAVHPSQMMGQFAGGRVPSAGHQPQDNSQFATAALPHWTQQSIAARSPAPFLVWPAPHAVAGGGGSMAAGGAGSGMGAMRAASGQRWQGMDPQQQQQAQHQPHTQG